MKTFLAQVVQVHAKHIPTTTNEWLNPYIHTQLRQNPEADAEGRTLCQWATLQTHARGWRPSKGPSVSERLCLHFDHSAHFPIHIIILSELKFASIPEQAQMNSPEQTRISKIKIPRKIEMSRPEPARISAPFREETLTPRFQFAAAMAH